MHLEEENLIDDLKAGKQEALEFLYETYRKPFIKWASYTYNLDVETAEDVYSDAVIDVYQNVQSERYKKKSTTSFKSYLFEVGKYKILNIFSKSKMAESHSENVYTHNYSHLNVLQDTAQQRKEMVQNVKLLMSLLDEKCKKVLTLYYFHNMSMDSIAGEMNFKNEDVSKNKKLKCLKRLQELTFERYSKSDFFD